MEDITIKLRPTIDTKDINKEMNEIAKTSQTAMEQTFRSMELTMRKSFEAWGKDMSKVGSNVDMDAFTGDFVDKMKELNAEIRETGNLPLGMSTKMYRAYQDVANLVDKYRELVTASREFTDTQRVSETPRFARLNQEITKTSDTIGVAESKIKHLKSTLDSLGEKNKLVESLKDGQTTLDKYNEKLAKIREYEEQIAHLKSLQGGFDYSTGRATRGLFGDDLAKNVAQIRELEQEIEKVKKTFNFFGSEGLTKLEKIKELEAQIPSTLANADNSKILEQIDAEKARLESLKAKYDELIAKRKAMPQSERYTQSSSPEWQKITNEIQKTEREIVLAAARVNELNEATKKTGTSFSQWRNIVWSVSRVLGNVYTISLDIVRGAKQIANFYKAIWSYVSKVVGWFKKLRNTLQDTASEHAKSFKQMLRDVIRYSLGIRSLFALFRKLRKALKDAFSELAGQVPEVNKVMSELLSTFNMVKGSLATAFEPIVTAIAPMLDFLMEKIAQVLTYIGMFFAALSGRGFVYKANKTMADFAASTGGAAKNAKELNKQLQGFDELNNLTTKDKNKSGGEGPLAEFEKVDIPDWLKNLAQKIKDIFNRIMDPIKEAWAKVGDYVVEAWKRAFNSVKDLLHDIGRDFLIVWDRMGEHIAEMFFLILGDVGNIIANIADKIREAWNFIENPGGESNGIRFWTAILGIVDAILTGVRKITLNIRDWTAEINLTPAMTAFVHWLESLVPITQMVMEILYQFWDRALKPILTWVFDGENSGIAKFFQILADFNDKLDKEKIINDLNRIWDALSRFGIDIGEGLLMFMERMLGYFADWLNSDSFTQWCEDVANFFDSLEPEALADDLEQIVRIIQNVAEWIWKTVKYVIDHKDEILDFIELLSEHLDTLAKGAVFGKLAIDIGRFTANLILLGGAIGKVFGAGAAAGEAGAGIGGLGATFSAMIGPASAVLAVIGALIADFLIFYNTVEEFRNSIDSTWSTVGETISSNFAKIKEALGPAVENVKKAGESLYDLALKLGIFDGLMATFDLVSNVIATVATSISGAITTIVQLISGDFTGAWETFKETISTGFDFLKNIFSDVATIISAPFNTMKEIVLEFWDFIIGKFTDGKVSISDTIDSIKQNLVDKFNAIKTEVVDIVTELWRKVTELIRKIIESITGIKTAVGSISTTISGAMAGIKSGINSVATQMNQKFQTRIPHLAQGAVIPPNNEFLAVLGDQRRGTNIESPLSTMVDAFNMANKGGSEAELALLQEQNDLLRQLLNKEFGISESQIFRSVRNQNNMYKKSTGNSAFA